jgi:F-type H+-transporting ATPase subunit gamma
MANVRSLKRRIRSAKNIKQITKAMEMVAASKMRRSQEKALTTRPYSLKIKLILGQLGGQIETEKHPMLKLPEDKGGSIGIILISSDRGLCGALNTNLFRITEDFKLALGQEKPDEVLSFDYITVGKKAREYVLKTGQSLYAEFTNFPEKPLFQDVLPIARLAIDGFNTDKFKEIHILYTAFITTLKQEVKSARVIPIETEKLKAEMPTTPRPFREYIFEPSPDAMLDTVLPHYIEMQVYQAIIEARASEHSARMVSMRNASDNASEIISELTLVFNKQRQQSITNEIADIVTSREAVSKT